MTGWSGGHKRPRRWGTTAVAAAALLSAAACDREASSEGLLARAGEHTLTVERAAQVIGGVPTLPERAEVVEAFAELWIDLTLLADAMARDSTLADLDLEPVARHRIEQEIVFAALDTLVPRDTTISDEALERRYAAEGVGVRVGAAHILFKLRVGATHAQRDSVFALADEVRNRARAGEDFAALARRYSQDPSTAALGGDLGTFEPAALAEPLNAAVLRLPLGTVGDPLLSAFGVHLVRVGTREVRGFTEVRDAYRKQVVQRMRARSDSLFWAGLAAAGEPTLDPDAVMRARRMAADPSVRVSVWRRGDPMVAYGDGSLTLEEVRLLLQANPAGARRRFISADSAAVAASLLEMARRDMLLAWARRQGLEPRRTQVDSLTTEARRQLAEMARGMELRIPVGTPRADRAQAVQAVVYRAVERVLSGRTDPVPLGQISFRLRERAGAEVVASAAESVAEEVRRRRGAAPSGSGS